MYRLSVGMMLPDPVAELTNASDHARQAARWMSVRCNGCGSAHDAGLSHGDRCWGCHVQLVDCVRFRRVPASLRGSGRTGTGREDVQGTGEYRKHNRICPGADDSSLGWVACGLIPLRPATASGLSWRARRRGWARRLQRNWPNGAWTWCWWRGAAACSAILPWGCARSTAWRCARWLPISPTVRSLTPFPTPFPDWMSGLSSTTPPTSRSRRFLRPTTRRSNGSST